MRNALEMYPMDAKTGDDDEDDQKPAAKPSVAKPAAEPCQTLPTPQLCVAEPSVAHPIT